MSLLSSLLNWFICAYIVILPLAPEKLKFMGMNIPSDVILLSIIVLYVIGAIFNRNTRVRFINGFLDFLKKPLSLFMLGLLTIMIISVTYSTERKLALNESARFLVYIVLYFVIKYGTNSRRELKNILLSYISVTAILGILGIIQYFTGFGLDKKFIFDYKYGATIRIAATLDNPNAFSAFLILALFPLIMLILSERNKSRKFVYVFLSLLVTVNIVMTGSRNALLAICIGIIALSIMYNWRLIYFLIVGAITSCFIPQVYRRLKDITDPTQNLSRIKIWSTALRMIKEHPILGVGNGNFVSLYDTYVKRYPELEYPDYKRMPSHNSYLKVESELGIFGISAFLGVLIYTIIDFIKLIKIENNKFFNFFYKGFVASSVSFIFMNLSDNLFFVPKVAAYFWIITACCQYLLDNNASGIEQKNN